jgi:hypothetical protein
MLLREAGAATEMTRQLMELLGYKAAVALMSKYTQAVLRNHGKKQRYWVEADGSTLRLLLQKNVAPH